MPIFLQRISLVSFETGGPACECYLGAAVFPGEKAGPSSPAADTSPSPAGPCSGAARPADGAAAEFSRAALYTREESGINRKGILFCFVLSILNFNIYCFLCRVRPFYLNRLKCVRSLKKK